MAQTSYTQTMPTGMAGMKAEAIDDQVESYAAEGAIGFGLAVIRGTDLLKQVKLPAAGGGVFRGVSLQTHTIVQSSSGVAQYADTDAVSVLRKGKVWVPVTGAVTIDAPAFFDNGSANAGADAGKFSATDDSSTDAVPTGLFRTSTSGAGLAILEVNLP
jgi:hypothetical protein